MVLGCHAESSGKGIEVERAVVKGSGKINDSVNINLVPRSKPREGKGGKKRDGDMWVCMRMYISKGMGDNEKRTGGWWGFTRCVACVGALGLA